MTTNTNPSRTAPARFFASATPNAEGLYTITDRLDSAIVTTIKGRAAARATAALLTAIDLTDQPLIDQPAAEPAAKPTAKRTSHADCDHASTKLARAICRRDRAAARIVGEQVEASKADA